MVKLKAFRAFKALVGLNGISTIDIIYIVKGLSHALMSRQMLKESGPLHRDLPYHL
jgi:hypothetical protein